MRKVKATASLCVYFLLSWTPVAIIAGVRAISGHDNIPDYAVDLAIILAFGSSLGNPVLYFLSQQNVRKAFLTSLFLKLTSYNTGRMCPVPAVSHACSQRSLSSPCPRRVLPI